MKPWLLLLCVMTMQAAALNEGVVNSNGVNIHYVTTGKGPLVVMVHGFPDYWYTWRNQMEALAADYEVVAIDTRGYNLSGKPAGEENYDMKFLIADVAAVIRAFNQEKAILVGHDWGGIISWQFTFAHPEMVSKLIILNLPHPNGLMRELANNPKQKTNSAYARRFQQPDSEKALTAEGLAQWVTDPIARASYVEAFKRSDFKAMMSYYRRNYPREGAQPGPPAPRIKVPVLQFHGLKDQYLLSDGLNNTWDWIDGDYTLVTVPNAGHFVQQDASDLVSRTMKAWLNR